VIYLSICSRLRNRTVIRAKETKDLIVEASSYPLSIIVVGVGDGALLPPATSNRERALDLDGCVYHTGPFALMETFDDGLPKRKFDNVRVPSQRPTLIHSLAHHGWMVRAVQFQFVNFNEVMESETPDVAFALRALMEIPEQFKSLVRLNVIKKRTK